MRKHWFRSIGRGGLSAIGLVLGLQQAARAADNVKIEIIRDKGKFVFADLDVKIDAIGRMVFEDSGRSPSFGWGPPL